MIPFLGALAGLVNVRCTRCGEVQSASRKQASVRCKACKRSFSQKEGRAAFQRAVDRLRRRK